MTKLYITEYAMVGGIAIQVPLEPPIAEQVIDYTAGVATSNPLTPETTLIRLHTDAICSVEIGHNPIATTNSQRMAANQTEYKSISPNVGMTVSAISNQ